MMMTKGGKFSGVWISLNNKLIDSSSSEEVASEKKMINLSTSGGKLKTNLCDDKLARLDCDADMKLSGACIYWHFSDEK